MNMQSTMNHRPRFADALAIAGVVFALAAYTQTAGAEDTAAQPEPTGLLTLENAVALALERNPILAAFSWDIRTAEARQLQAGLRPNPELTVEMEDIRLGHGAGTRTSLSAIGWSADGLSARMERERETGPRRGLSEAQFTLSLSQLIELGGKRAQRIRLAARDREVAAWDYEAARADVLKEVSRAFVKVLTAQQRVALEDELVQLAEHVVQTVSSRVSAGRVSPLEATKAETALSVARVQSTRSKRELDSARVRLSTLWGGTEAGYERAEGDLSAIRGIPSLEELNQRVGTNPDLARWQAELEKRETLLSVERSKAAPDLTVNGGIRVTGLPDSRVRSDAFGLDGFSRTSGSARTNAGRDTTVVLGFSVPLPLFNRNQGSIKEAERLVAKAGEERRAADLRVRADLTASYQNVSAALAAITALSETILPAATQTFASINEAYSQGKFGYLDVLDAQRTLFEARQQHLDALASYHENIADLERSLGESLWTVVTSKSPLEKEK